MNQIGVIKTHFNLRRMYVHVIVFVGYSNEQKDDGKSVRFHEPAIGFFDCV